MKGSVRKRLLLGTGIGVALALAVSGVLVFVLVERALIDQFDDGLEARARALSILVEQDGDKIEFDDISRETAPGEYFELYAGESLLRSKSLGDGHLRAVDGSVRVGGASARQRALSFTPRVESDEGAVMQANATMVYARSTAELDATVARLRNILIGVGAGALVLALGLLAWIARRGLRPVDDLAADIAAIRETGKRIDEDRPKELVVIAQRLNELLARLDRAFARERALTAEVAHELRTPLAGLRATIELALDRERAPERYREALSQSLAITTQTERMVESMLSLAKLDAGMVPVAAQWVELDVIVREVLASHAARISERELAVATNLTAVTAHTDPAKLASVLHNLVDNAISYSEARGSITVDVEPHTIRITNTGCTLDDTTHVFERFWRGDAARTAGTHAGLGLSIAKTLVELLGGSITARVADHRFIATIVLPGTSETSSARTAR